MGKKVPYTNTRPHPVTVGLVRIDPGCTRTVEETMIPGFKPAKSSVTAPAPDPVAEFLGGKAAAIVKAVPDQATEFLSAARAAEAEGKARKTVLEAMDAELLERAANAADDADGDQSDNQGDDEEA